MGADDTVHTLTFSLKDGTVCLSEEDTVSLMVASMAGVTVAPCTLPINPNAPGAQGAMQRAGERAKCMCMWAQAWGVQAGSPSFSRQELDTPTQQQWCISCHQKQGC